MEEPIKSYKTEKKHINVTFGLLYKGHNSNQRGKYEILKNEKWAIISKRSILE